MEEQADKEESKKFREIQGELLELAGATNVGDFVPWLQSRELERRMSALGKKRDKFLQDLVEEVRGGSMASSAKEERKKTMLEVLLSLQATEPENYPDVVIKAIIVVSTVHFQKICSCKFAHICFPARSYVCFN